METPGDLDERGRRDALIEPLFGGLDAAQGAESEHGEGDGRGSVAWGFWSLLVLVALASWLLS